MLTGTKFFFRAISTAGIWGDISALREAKDTKPKTRGRALELKDCPQAYKTCWNAHF